MTQPKSKGPPDVQNDFEAWALVSAKLLERTAEQQQRIVEDLGIADVWMDSKIFWGGKLADELLANESTLADRYGELCEAEITRRENNGDVNPDAEPAVIAPEPREDPADFRHELVRTPEVPSASDSEDPSADVALLAGAETTLTDPNEQFFEKLAPPGRTPQPPDAQQQQTAAVATRDTAVMVRSAAVVMQWSVEKYAKFCAKLETYPDKAVLYRTNHGLEDDLVFRFVQDKWRRQLAKDAALQSQFDQLVAGYCKLLKRQRKQ